MRLADYSVTIIGAGLMGHGIAQVFAEAGARVIVHDPTADALASLSGRVRQNLKRLRRDLAAADRISPCGSIPEAVREADLVIEAGPEQLEVKRSIFEQLDACAPVGAILATNTSVIPVGRIAAGLAHDERVIGTHWWNPPYLVPLVEVVQAEATSPTVVEQTLDLLRAAGKTPVHVERDIPGFVGNRLQHALWREAVALVSDGVCQAETVDTVVKQSFGLRLSVLGPLENADLIGLDLTLAIHEQVLPYIDRTPGPSPYLRQLVSDGRLGMKSGHGFRTWSPEQADGVRAAVADHLNAVTQTTSAGDLAAAVPKEENTP